MSMSYCCDAVACLSTVTVTAVLLFIYNGRGDSDSYGHIPLMWSRADFSRGYETPSTLRINSSINMMGFIPLRPVNAKYSLLGWEESLTNNLSETGRKEKWKVNSNWERNWDTMQVHLVYVRTRSSNPSRFPLCIIQKPSFSTGGKNPTPSGIICEQTSACSMWDLRLGLFKEMFILGHIMVEEQCLFS